MPKRLTFHAFTQLGWPDANNGLWRHPDLVPPQRTTELSWWIDFARLAERGRFDTLFFADAVGNGGFVKGDLQEEILRGRMVIYDPSTILTALAAATDHIGFIFTSSILQDHPFNFARKVSTLDQFTGGRIGWNIVTSYTPNAARNFGYADLPSREERYRWADEYADVTYRLWEGSWEDGALLRDVKTGVFADPARVHTLDYVGERYKVEGPHLTPPTPQRTPLLVQAGGSPDGQAFAARHAETQFITDAPVEAMAKTIAGVRKLAIDAGRQADDIKFIVSCRFVIGSTEEEAARKAKEIDEKVDLSEIATGLRTAIGVDLTGYDFNMPITELKTLDTSGGMQGVLKSIVDSLPKDRTPTIAEVLRAHPFRRRIVGSPERIADLLQSWLDAGIDGVALGMPIRPGALIDFVEHVVPILQKRGLAQREYTPGTLRQKIMGYGDRLPARHPAARHRR